MSEVNLENTMDGQQNVPEEKSRSVIKFDLWERKLLTLG